MLQKLAATPADSQERFRARAILPGMAKRLREVSFTFCLMHFMAAMKGNASSPSFRERFII